METADFTASGIYNWRRGLDDFISCSGPINLILVSLYEISHPTVGIIFDSFKLSIGLLIFKVWKKSKWCLLTFEKVADFKWTDPYIHHWSFLSHVHCLMFIVSCSMFLVPCLMLSFVPLPCPIFCPLTVSNVQVYIVYLSYWPNRYMWLCIMKRQVLNAPSPDCNSKCGHREHHSTFKPIFSIIYRLRNHGVCISYLKK